MRLLLAPHALTDWNIQGRYQGQTDTVLSVIGRRQADLLAERLHGERIDEVHASDLRRAQETCSAVCQRRDLHWQSEPRLRELHFGVWEGLTYQEVQQNFAKELAAWEADPLRIAPPRGETVAQLADRIGGFLAGLRVSPQEAKPVRATKVSDRSLSDQVPLPNGRSSETVLLVAHRGTLRTLICLALGISPAARWQFRLEPASLSELNLHEKGAVLMFLNDTHHLREAAHAC
jgi:broad specificity phosphatase PhoE